MKKIRNIKHLEAEKKRMRDHQGELEKKITHNWREVKTSVRPSNLAKQAFGGWVDSRTDKQFHGETILQSVLSYGAAMLAKKFVTKAQDKFGKFFRKKD